jgi:hypothetical protein
MKSHSLETSGSVWDYTSEKVWPSFVHDMNNVALPCGLIRPSSGDSDSIYIFDLLLHHHHHINQEFEEMTLVYDNITVLLLKLLHRRSPKHTFLPAIWILACTYCLFAV